MSLLLLQTELLLQPKAGKKRSTDRSNSLPRLEEQQVRVHRVLQDPVERHLGPPGDELIRQLTLQVV
jgi:hypothetical protein